MFATHTNKCHQLQQKPPVKYFVFEKFNYFVRVYYLELYILYPIIKKLLLLQASYQFTKYVFIPLPTCIFISFYLILFNTYFSILFFLCVLCYSDCHILTVSWYTKEMYSWVIRTLVQSHVITNLTHTSVYNCKKTYVSLPNRRHTHLPEPRHEIRYKLWGVIT